MVHLKFAFFPVENYVLFNDENLFAFVATSGGGKRNLIIQKCGYRGNGLSSIVILLIIPLSSFLVTTIQSSYFWSN